MNTDTIKIVHAEHAIFVAQLNAPQREGYTVAVPNIIDRAVAALKRFFTRTSDDQLVKAGVYGAAGK